MGINGPEIAGFVGGLLLCAGVVTTIFLLARQLLESAGKEGEGGGRPKGFKAFLMIALLAIKTFGAGLGVWLLLVVWRLPLGAFALGLFFGLSLTVIVALFISMRAEKKNP